jgi:hypothetical protein
MRYRRLEGIVQIDDPMGRDGTDIAKAQKPERHQF